MNSNRKIRILGFIAAPSALMLIAGCAVGPNFKKPASPTVGGYTAAPLSTTASVTNVPGGEAQRFVENLDIPGEWWELFHSQPLNDLIERSLTNSPSIKAAQAALTMARENLLDVLAHDADDVGLLLHGTGEIAGLGHRVGAPLRGSEFYFMPYAGLATMEALGARVECVTAPSRR